MKRLYLPVLLLVAGLLSLSVSVSHGQAQGMGIGASIGVTNGDGVWAKNPIGLDAKVWLSDHQAVTATTSFFIGDGGSTPQVVPSYWVMQGNYLFHNFNELEVGEGLMALYIGAGGQLTVLEDVSNQFAVRAPTGVTYLLGSAPIDVFVEVAPTLSVTDPTTLRFDGAIGFRYYFSSGSGMPGK